MVERFIQNNLTLKRWRRFKSVKRSVYASWTLIFLIFLSFTAEMWANSKPIVMSYENKIYFPIYNTYHPSEFGKNEGFITDYRSLSIEENSWIVWPLVVWDPYESNKQVSGYPSQPSVENWFGTDDRGRDVLTRLLYGFRYSFGFAILVWILSYILGIMAGAVMGFFGGRVDMISQRFVEVFESAPGLLLLITLVSIFDASLWLLAIFSTFFGWMGISYFIRAEFLKLRKREFVEAARAIGGGKIRQIFKHILPNSLSPVITFSPFAIAGGISSLAVLDYLGFGLPAPTPSWGELLHQAQIHFSVAWWLAVFPSLALFVSLVVMNLIGEGVRDAFDPRKT